MLLSLRGVPNDYFLKLASNSIEDVRRLYGDYDRVMRGQLCPQVHNLAHIFELSTCKGTCEIMVSVLHWMLQNSGAHKIVTVLRRRYTECLLLGMDPAKDAHLRQSLNTLAKWKFGDFRTLSWPMPMSWFLMGTADPTHSLEHDQIALIL